MSRQEVRKVLKSTTTDADSVDARIRTIASLQSRGQTGYGRGVFPSQRTHRYLPYSVEDDTIFFTAAIVYTLNAIRSDLSRESADLVTSMTRRCGEAVPRFLNNQGLPIYNYWQVHPEDRFFPNGAIFSHFRKFRLPEDIDTTAYVYLAGYHDRADAAWLQQRLAFHANGSQRWMRHSLPHHRHRRAYSTWMGEDNMPVDFDVCAMSNMLLALQAFDLPLSETDEATVEFIEAVVTGDEHLTRPCRPAPWYPSTSLILYHVARLLSRANIEPIRALREKLWLDVVNVSQRQDLPFMERIMLSTAAMWLGEKPLISEPLPTSTGNADEYAFFVASLLAVPENRLARMLAPLPVFQLRFRSHAHSLALMVEHEVLRRRCGRPTSP